MRSERGGRCDLLIAGGMVVDGSGGDAFAADVAVVDGRIAGVTSDVSWSAEQTIDASGLAVAPGFIDVHTHDELEAVRHPAMTAKISQGVTTVVAGNCGISAAPLRPTSPLPAPYPLIGDDGDFRFPSVDDYRSALEGARPSVNVALLCGHTSLRLMHVADLSRPALPAEVEAMAATLGRSLEEGCIGLSSGVEYPPAAAADLDELIGVARAATAHPGAVYATHIRNESDDIVPALEEAFATSRASSVPLILSHHKCAGQANYGRSLETLALVDDARNESAVGLDVYPYTAGSTSLLEGFVARAESTLIAWSTPHPECAGRSFDDVMAEWGCDAAEAVERLSPAGGVYFLIDEGDLQRILRHPAAMIGSDGLPGRSRPHPRLWGTFPRVLGRYVRELKVLTLTEAVHKMTGLPATTFPLGDRGFVRNGMIADLTVFSPAEIGDTATYDDPEQPATGIEHVIVNGVPSWTNGGPTGDRAGRFLA